MKSELVVVWDGLEANAMSRAITVVQAWPQLFGDGIQHCELHCVLERGFLALTTVFDGTKLSSNSRWRLDFWVARTEGATISASAAPERAELARKQKACKVALHRINASDLPGSVAKIAGDAGFAIAKKAKLELDVTISKLSDERVLVIGGRTAVFVPLRHAPPVGDALRVRLQIVGDGTEEHRLDAEVLQVRRPTSGTGAHTEPGFMIGFRDLTPVLDKRIRAEISDRVRGVPTGVKKGTEPPGAERRNAEDPRVPVVLQVEVRPVALAAPAPAPSVRPAMPTSGVRPAMSRGVPKTSPGVVAVPTTSPAGVPLPVAPARAQSVVPPPGAAVVGFRHPPRTPRPPSQQAPVARLSYKDDEEFAREYVENLSKGGAFVRTESPLSTDSRVELLIQLPRGDMLHANGVVVFVGAGGMGIQFALEPATRKLLEDYLSTISRA